MSLLCYACSSSSACDVVCNLLVRLTDIIPLRIFECQSINVKQWHRMLYFHRACRCCILFAVGCGSPNAVRNTLTLWDLSLVLSVLILSVQDTLESVLRHRTLSGVQLAEFRCPCDCTLGVQERSSFLLGSLCNQHPVHKISSNRDRGCSSGQYAGGC
jgi:hypothetical protein